MDLVNLSIGSGLTIAVMGYCVVFVGLVLLMIVVMIMGRYFISKAAKGAAETVVQPVEASPVKAAEPAPGSAGELKLYDTDPRDAAMIMAIVADHLGVPLNELRFKSIREVK